MRAGEFRVSIEVGELPPGLPTALVALWLDGRGDWTAAHDQLQDATDRDSGWVHAYLHRKEGDLANAGYWYRRAGRRVFEGKLEQEWDEIVSALLPVMG